MLFRSYAALPGARPLELDLYLPPTDSTAKDQPPFIPDFPRMQAAAQQHDMQFMRDFEWPDA